MTTRDNSPIGRAWRSHMDGRNDSAVEEFRQIVASAPNDLDALYGLGMALRAAGQKAEAIEMFQKILDTLSGMKAGSEDEANRMEMLRRMSRQQIDFAKD